MLEVQIRQKHFTQFCKKATCNFGNWTSKDPNLFKNEQLKAKVQVLPYV